MTRAEAVLQAAQDELVAGAAAQRAARGIIARVVARAAARRQRDMVEASLHARAGHDVGGPLRRGGRAW